MTAVAQLQQQGQGHAEQKQILQAQPIHILGISPCWLFCFHLEPHGVWVRSVPSGKPWFSCSITQGTNLSQCQSGTAQPHWGSHRAEKGQTDGGTDGPLRFAAEWVLAMPAPTAALSSLPLSPAAFPASTLEEMGRKEEDDSSSWKKQTSNIRKTFIFMEALGS